MASGSPIPGTSAPAVLIGREEVLRRTGVQKTDATVGWVEAEIEGWIQEREALQPGPSAKRTAEVPPGPPAKPATCPVSVLAWPEGPPAAGQFQSLNAEQTTQLIGRGCLRPKAVEPQYIFDPLSGTVWVRVLKI